MSDNVQLNIPDSSGAVIATEDIAGVQHQKILIEFSEGDGTATQVSGADPLPVTDAAVLAKLSADPATQTTLAAVLAKLIAAPATEATLAAIAVSLSGQQTDALTDAELRATPVPISGTVVVDTSLLATGAKQDSQTALLTTIDTDTGNISTKIDTVAGAVSGTEMQVDIVTMPNVVIGSGTVTAVTSITNTVATKEVRSATPSQSSPSVTNASTSILASNANRLGATIWNEGAAICYMKLGATASTTSYSVQIASGGYYEVPFGYTAAIDGITSSGTAQLRVTELTT